jgi:hypothetical protein
MQPECRFSRKVTHSIAFSVEELQRWRLSTSMTRRLPDAVRIKPGRRVATS